MASSSGAKKTRIFLYPRVFKEATFLQNYELKWLEKISFSRKGGSSSTRKLEGIPLWEKIITRGKRSGKETSITVSYTSHWETVSVKWNNLSFYQIIKEMICQGETFDCFDNQQ